jgi:SPP1 gp7 family putative phage head morphogenesis protein
VAALTDNALHAAAYAATLRLLHNRVAKAQLRVYRLGALAAKLDLGVGPFYDPQAQAFVAQFEYEAIDSLTARQASRIRDVTLDGVRRGLGQERVLQAVRDVVEAGEARLRAIARTELNRAANWGRYTGWKESGRVREKEYVATTDDRVRPGHLAAHGERVPIDQPFTRGDAAGYLMPPIAPNCRCTAVPVTRFSGLAGLPAQATTQEIEGLRAAELAHTRDLLRVWQAWPRLLERELGAVLV